MSNSHFKYQRRENDRKNNPRRDAADSLVTEPTVKKILKALGALKKDRSWEQITREVGITSNAFYKMRTEYVLNSRHLIKFKRWIERNMPKVKSV